MGHGWQHKMNVTSWQTIALYCQWNAMLKMESQETFTDPLHCRDIYQRKQYIETPSDAKVMVKDRYH